MSETSIKAMLEFIIPRLIRMLMEKQSLTEKEALTQLYSSELYRQLEREETKLWHLSVPTLYDLWVEEKETGHMDDIRQTVEDPAKAEVRKTKRKMKRSDNSSGPVGQLYISDERFSNYINGFSSGNLAYFFS